MTRCSYLPLDDTDTYLLASVADELATDIDCERARHVADVRILLREQHAAEGVDLGDRELDALAEQIVADEQAEAFLRELCGRLRPDADVLELAALLNDNALSVWREAARSLVEVCPPSFSHLRLPVEEERRAELRTHDHLVRAEAQIGAILRSFGWFARLRHRAEVAERRSELLTCWQLRARSKARLVRLNAKIEAIAWADQARSAWLLEAHDVLVRGVAAVEVLQARADPARTDAFDLAAVEEVTTPPEPPATDSELCPPPLSAPELVSAAEARPASAPRLDRPTGSSMGR